MLRKTLFLTAFALTAVLLQGCAGAVVGGAATGLTVANDRRTVGTFVDDEIIEVKAVKRLFSDKEIFDNTHINVTAYNNIVLLSGEAPTETLRNKAYNIVLPIPKVRKIHNEVMIAAPSSLLTRSSDTWITAKVKTNLFQIKNAPKFDPTKVKVVSENGTVFLMGILKRSEAELVINATRTVGGVQRVVKLFEYID